jgi:dienelactone hydrolase
MNANSRSKFVIHYPVLFILFAAGIFGLTKSSLAACNINPAGLVISGDPGSTKGASWTYKSTDGGTAYDFYGTLLKPAGLGPFPGGVVNHGDNGVPSDMSTVATAMRSWGMVVISPVLTHCRNDAGYEPAGGAGADPANMLRVRKSLAILCYLGYVDMSRVAIHGHSAGAYVTTDALDTYPNSFKVGSHTGGGSDKCTSTSMCGFMPAPSERDGIIAPYSLNHGDADTTVPLSWDQNLYNEFKKAGHPITELNIYPGLDHQASHDDPAVLTNIREWYTNYGLFSAGDTTVPDKPKALTVN